MNLKKSRKPVFIAAIIAALLALLFVPFVQNIGIYLAENLLLKRPLAKPEKWIGVMRLYGSFGVFLCFFFAAVYWFEISIKNISLFCFLLQLR